MYGSAWASYPSTPFSLAQKVEAIGRPLKMMLFRFHHSTQLSPLIIPRQYLSHTIIYSHIEQCDQHQQRSWLRLLSLEECRLLSLNIGGISLGQTQTPME